MGSGGTGVRGSVVDIQVSSVEKRKSLGRQAAELPWTFLKAQGRALLHGPGQGRKEKDLQKKWDLRIREYAEGKPGQVWSVEMRGREMRGTIQVGDEVFIPGEHTAGELIYCTEMINESAGGTRVRVR